MFAGEDDSPATLIVEDIVVKSNEKRKDPKGRVLRPGERYREDGRYMYRYTDKLGKRQHVYSHKLTSTDKVDEIYVNEPSLREIEDNIKRDQLDNINTKGAEITFNEQFHLWMDIKTKLSVSTKLNYEHLWRKHIKDTLGAKRLKDIKTSQLKQFFNKLSDKEGLSAGTLHLLNNIIYPVLQMAVDDDLLRKNYCAGIMKYIEARRSPKRIALSESQQEVFIRFLKQSNRHKYHLPLFVLALGTGMRSGEICGLRWCDINLKKGYISVNHTLQYKSIKGKQCFYISKPKTECGNKEIPILSEVKRQLVEQKRYIIARQIPTDYIVDGYSNFVFLTKSRKPYTNGGINNFLKSIIKDCNTWEIEQAQKEGRSPVLLPPFSIHNLRHTFCSRLCAVVHDYKSIQMIMGHSDIRITMDVYNHYSRKDIEVTMEALEGRLRIS